MEKAILVVLIPFGVFALFLLIWDITRVIKGEDSIFAPTRGGRKKK